MLLSRGCELSLTRCVALKRAVVLLSCWKVSLSAEAVQSAALSLKSIHHVHGGDGLPFGVLGVGDSIADHVLQENLQHAAGLLVDQTGDTLHSATASQAADGGLGNSLDVITENFAVTLCASFAEPFSSLSSSRHLSSVR